MVTQPKKLPSVFVYPDNVVRIADYERKSREPDAAGPRDPSEAAVIIMLPSARTEPPCECPCM